MSLIRKLLPSRKVFKCDNERRNVNDETADDVRYDTLRVGADRVRILLFRECEWRGKKLLFDSVTLEKHRCRKKSTCEIRKNETDMKSNDPDSNFREFELGKTIEDDVSLLSEMVFGTVAMTYRGPSFKVHSMKSPPCLMCTKVFPATEHSTCKQSEGNSDEALGKSLNVDANSSTTSILSHLSRPSSGNLIPNELTTGPRKSSTCSSTGSGWDIDIPPPLGSTQSLESMNSSSPNIGSLSSLRRRWLRAMSTSLSRCDSDDTFGMQWNENGKVSRDKRHKSRLGLAMLVGLTCDEEGKIERRLLEHMGLLEGMLDRLRYFCIEISDNNYHSNRKGFFLAERMYRASFRVVLSLLEMLMITDRPAPLLWHDVLLNSVGTKEQKINSLELCLQQMCQLVDLCDTKSTNFFLSTIVTAVLTYHLGWVYTVLPLHDRQMLENLGRWYPCNPLWAQLGDLYGALGNPVKVAHTVITGDPQKSDMINSVLTFLTYFIRSGIVRKHRESRCSSENDVREAVSVYERARINNPYLFFQARQIMDKDIVLAPSHRALKQNDHGNSTDRHITTDFSLQRSRIESLPKRSLTHSVTVKSNLDEIVVKEKIKEELESKIFSGRFLEKSSTETVIEENETCTPSKVKILVNDTDSTLKLETKLSEPHADESLVLNKLELSDSNNASNCNAKLYADLPEGLMDPYDRNSFLVNKEAQVYFMLGDEDKYSKSLSRLRSNHTCQCSYMFNRVPSTSAQLPEGVLRKIIQRNFPESSKNMQPSPSATASISTRSFGYCLKCNGQGTASSNNYDSSKQLLETPTNATEVLRTCANNEQPTRISRSNSLEALMDANSIVELPMPRSKKITSELETIEEAGYTKTLIRNRVPTEQAPNSMVQGYTWGLVVQGLVKSKRKRRRKCSETAETESEKNWWWFLRDEAGAEARFPTIDQPVTEALCVLGDLDSWHVGILSSNTPSQNAPLTVGMSRLVANMLEAFSYVWRKYHSASYCVEILEGKLREMFLRSEALAEMLMTTEVCEASIDSLTNALDLDAADIPLLLAVATTHTPQLAQRFGLTLA